MKTKFILLVIVLGLKGLSIYSQTLTPMVVSSSGGYFTTANSSLSFTVAEMTMVETFTSAGNILTQGFQQPELVSVSVSEKNGLTENIMIYPNPSNGKFKLCYIGYNAAEIEINIHNLLGQIVYSKPYSQKIAENTVSFDISYFKPGIYLLELKTKNSNGEIFTTYNKINLVY